MPLNNHSRPSSSTLRHHAFDSPNGHHAHPPPPPALDPLEWYPHFQSCLRFFLEHSQHSPLIQAVAAYMNILLPSQHPPASRPDPVSLTPYIRRLVVTGLDTAPLLHRFFGDDWPRGVGPLHDLERRNYLFAAKSACWLDVKASYEPSPAETVPCMAPLRNPSETEILAAEAAWSEWLALQDWMVGPRAPVGEGEGKREVGE